MKKSIILLMTAGAAVLSGCGGGGGSGAAPSPTLDISANLSGVTPAARAKALNAGQQLGSVTQSSRIDGGTNTTLDRVQVKTDDNDNLILAPADAAEAAGNFPNSDVVIENTGTEQKWEGSRNNPPAGYQLFIVEDIVGEFDGNLRSKIQYEPGDYYLVSGFWYRDDSDFGVFADGSELTDPLPTSGSATYNGRSFGVYWDRIRTLQGSQVFVARAEFNAVYSGSNLQISGSARNFNGIGALANIDAEDITVTPFLSSRVISFAELTYNTERNGVTEGNLSCEPGCTVENGSWGGQFAGNPPDETNGWPFAFLGTFGAQGISDGDDSYDILGVFETVHEDLPDIVQECFGEDGCVLSGSFGNDSILESCQLRNGKRDCVSKTVDPCDLFPDSCSGGNPGPIPVLPIPPGDIPPTAPESIK